MIENLKMIFLAPGQQVDDASHAQIHTTNHVGGTTGRNDADGKAENFNVILHSTILEIIQVLKKRWMLEHQSNNAGDDGKCNDYVRHQQNRLTMFLVKLRNIMKFEHKNSVLLLFKRGRAECAAGIALPVAHLFAVEHNTQKKTLGVISRHKNAEKRGISIIYKTCAAFTRKASSSIAFPTPTNNTSMTLTGRGE